MLVTQIFLLFFHNSFFFVYRHSDLEGSCSNATNRCCLRAVAGHEIWHWATRFEKFTERNRWAYDVCVGEVWSEGSFTLALFQSWGVRSKVLLEQVQLTFSFQNKFIILHPCGFLVDDNTFSKICVFKSLTGYTDYGGCEHRNARFLVIVKSKVMKNLMLVLKLFFCCLFKMMDWPCLAPI
jgi:hypothetical protein